MSKSAPRLGKGLSALIGPRPASPFRRRAPSPVAHSPLTEEPAATTLHHIPLSQIRPNPRQPRSALNDAALQQLAASIRGNGLLQPVIVRTMPDGNFELVAGERRWRAAQIAGLQTIPALIRELTDADSFETGLIENLQREDLGPLERAAAYQQLIDMLRVTIDVVATRLGESRASISNYLRLLNLGEAVQQMICSGQLGMGQARALAGVSNPQTQLAIARLAVRRNLSVRQVEALTKETDQPVSKAIRSPRPLDAQLANVEEALSKALGLSVKLLPGKKKNSGRIVIRYDSLDEFDRIAEKIGGHRLLE